MDACPHPTCFAPHTSCALGEIEVQRCSRWRGGEGEASSDRTPEDHVLLPWTGNVLGLSDLSFITGREKPLIIGIAGPESAGKTTMLGSWYLLMGRGRLLDEGVRFNGSYTLGGWEAVAASLRWAPGLPPSFPPHTASRDARAPGLLHLSLRRERERARDLLFADAPGAWFQKWAINAEDPEAAGVRWLSRNTDVWLLAADRQALAGPKRGQARNGFQLLAKRVAAERRGRPVALVWTKGDVAVDPEMESVIRAAVFGEISDAVEFTTSIFAEDGADRGTGLVSLFAWLRQIRRPIGDFPRERGEACDPLFLFGRR